MNMIRKRPYCKFYNSECIQNKCPGYSASRPMTVDEIEIMNARDIPVTNAWINHWCNIYDKQVSPYIIVEG